MKHEEEFITVTLGTFNKPNRNGETFTIDRKSLKRRLDKLIGKSVGEIGQPRNETGMNFSEFIQRVAKQDYKNTAGVLLSYEIFDNSDGSWQVNGKVSLSKDLRALIENDNAPTFGIRAFTRPSEGTIKEIDHLISFDYIAPINR